MLGWPRNSLHRLASGAGYVNLRALLVLAVGSWLGIRLASTWIGRIPDRIHARVYLLLLTMVLVVMVFVH